MISEKRDDLVFLPCDTESSPHEHVFFPLGHIYHYGGKCWCGAERPNNVVRIEWARSLRMKR